MADKKFFVRYLPAAEDDLLGILDWIAQDSPVRARSFIEKLDKKILLLTHAPLLGLKSRHAGLDFKGYRILVVETYLVFYKIVGAVVMIHRVVHGSRDLEGLV